MDPRVVGEAQGQSSADLSAALKPGRKVLIVAGEASGDLHAAHLIKELQGLDPSLDFHGLGGDEMMAVGLRSIAHSKEISVVGIAEVLKILPRARQLFRQLVALARKERPGVAVLVDFPDFNLRLAKELKNLGIPVVYYISPQIWAWRQSRVKVIADRVRRMLVLFPFELAFYAGHGVDAVHVGHPLVDEVKALARRSEQPPPQDSELQLCLLPGSRDSELRRVLPVLLQASFEVLKSRSARIRLIQAPTVSADLLEELLAPAALAGVPIERVTKQRFGAIADSDVALCASGTATLEVALLGTPMVVVYKVAASTFALAKALVKVDQISLVNLVLGEPAVPELVQAAAQPAAISTEVLSLCTPERWNEQRKALGRVRGALGREGGSREAAIQVLDVLDEVSR